MKHIRIGPPIPPGPRQEEPSSSAVAALNSILAINAEIERVSKILSYQIDDIGKKAWQAEVDKFRKQRDELVKEYKLARTLDERSQESDG